MAVSRKRTYCYMTGTTRQGVRWGTWCERWMRSSGRVVVPSSTNNQRKCRRKEEGIDKSDTYHGGCGMDYVHVVDVYFCGSIDSVFSE